MFQFGEDLFDGVEVGGIGRQEQKPGSASPDGAAHRLALVATERSTPDAPGGRRVIEDDDVARLQRWGQNLIDIGPEALAVDWTIENPWGLDTITPQGGEEGHCLPVTVRDLCREPPAPRAPTSDGSHVGLDPGFIDEDEEDETGRINPRLIFFPTRAAARHVGAILLVRPHAF